MKKSFFRVAFDVMLRLFQQCQNMFLFLDCRDTDRALTHIRSKNGYIYKRDFVRTYQYKPTKWPLICKSTQCLGAEPESFHCNSYHG